MEKRGKWFLALFVIVVLVLIGIFSFTSLRSSGYAISEGNVNEGKPYSLQFVGSEIKVDVIKVILSIKENQGKNHELEVDYFLIDSQGESVKTGSNLFIVEANTNNKYSFNIDRKSLNGKLDLLLISNDGDVRQETRGKIFLSGGVTGFAIFGNGTVVNSALIGLFLVGIILVFVFRRIYKREQIRNVSKFESRNDRNLIRVDLS